MNKNKKKLLTIFALGILAISTIAIGFAVTYYGETSTSGNTNESRHIVITIGNNLETDYEGNFDNPVRFDTVTTSTGTTWIPKCDSSCDGMDAVSLGTITLHVDETNTTNYYLTMATTGAMDHSKFIVGVRVGSAAEQYFNSSSYEFDITGVISSDKDVFVTLYYKGTQLTSAPPDNPLDDVTFTFKAYTED